jgi:ABC-type multidrug transport system permease subunit
MNKKLRVLFLSLLCVISFLLVMHFFPASVSKTIANRFDLNAEANVPTWFSTIVLFSVALTAAAIYFLKESMAMAERPWRRFWLIFSAVYAYLSLDEAARIHEILDVVLIKWVLVYAPFAGAFFIACVYYFTVIRKQDSHLRFWILGGLIAYAVGGLGAESVSHILRPLPNFWQQVEYIVEEGLEMIGMSMVWMGCLQELVRVYNLAHPPSVTKHGDA